MTEFTVTDDFPKNEAEFDKRFSKAHACYKYLFTIRWPDGFVCNACGHRKNWKSSRSLYICRRCEHQHSLTAGTILHSRKKPITSWFKAMWWFTSRKLLQSKAEDKSKTLPGVHLVSSLVKRLILGTFQGRFDKKHLQRYLDEYVFRFNRRTSTCVGKKFMRLVQQAMVTTPNPYYLLIQGPPVTSLSLEFSK